MGNTQSNNYSLQIAPLGAALSCEAVASNNFADVSTTVGSAISVISTTSNFTDQLATTNQLSTSYTFNSGNMVKNPSTQTNALSLSLNYSTEVEFNIKFTSNALSNTAYCLRSAKSGIALSNYSAVGTVTTGTISGSGPTMSQLMRHGKWFNGTSKQAFTF